ncbi:ARM repeat-containing protein [Fomitiporia mediterranea MF3/22]|uniref:ARM repeat-containing protein n=1 Tax=Fomitiporia mediterranea (strain MF3/22) TaxID=694068 RepID=UPI0004407E85|nr:ARM repeat-containing protein [Fomitiporia mediterranea MF3/22]EJD05837.1 ARM repeat-containing protein [Fomitiporia mediterranea MF3/22]
MGILVSWINTAWHAQLTDHDESDLPDHSALLHPVRDRPFDIGSDDVRPPLTHSDLSTTPALTNHLDSLVPTDSLSHSSLAASPQDSVEALSDSSVPNSVSADTRQHLLVSSDYSQSDRPVAMIEDVPQAQITRSSSPPPPPMPNLRIDVAAANDPTMDHEMVDASFVSTAAVPDPSDDLCFDDDGLSALEKIYLFARSVASFHRVFISRSLPLFLPEVPPCEAVEYVIPLMNGLAMDDDEAVKEALVEDLVSSIWWFLTRCQVVDHDVPEGAEPRDVPLLNVQAFTPLLGTLLLNPSASVNAPARHCAVNLLSRIRDAESSDTGSFERIERRLFERELIEHVVIGMAHLDSNSPVDESGSKTVQRESNVEQLDVPSSEVDIAKSPPPPSATDDEVLVSTLSSSAQALATMQFLAQEEPLPSRAAALAAIIQRPPSPLPTVQAMIVIPEREPEFAHIISRPATDEYSDVADPKDGASPMHDITPLPTWAAEPNHMLQNETAAREHVMKDLVEREINSPRPERASGSSSPMLSGETALPQPDVDSGEAGNEFNDEQAAIGKLASMSLIAAVTASGPLDREYQSAFVKEVDRAGHDSVYWVRREATFALGALAKVVPEELLYISLLPLFDCFCEDTIWNVRQSILFALPAILSRLPSDQRRAHALKTIQKFTNDPAPQVRTGVLEVLGEVIYSFHGDDRGPPDQIFRLFVGEEGRDWHGPDSPALEMTQNVQTRIPWAESAFRARFPPSPNEGFSLTATASSALSSSSPLSLTPGSDPARPLICAFNLPAVALTVGPKCWPDLRGLYVFLARTGTTKVRQTLAASIGEIARIIGPENARHDLIYRWWDFVRGRDAVVRMKALEALETFLQALNPSDRARIFGSLEEVWDNHLTGWREREVLARSMDRLAPLFPADGEVLRLVLRRALRDTTAAVRNAVIETYPQVYGSVLNRPEALRLVTEEVSSLVYDESFKKRLTYVECARSLVTSNPSYDRFMDDVFWQAAVKLASDKITDVRIGMARLLGIICDKILSRSRTLPGGVLTIVRTLSEDPISDVGAFVSHILAPDLRPPTELAYGHVSETNPSMALFSRPPPKREPRTLVAGINDMKISSVSRGDEWSRQSMDQAMG